MVGMMDELTKNLLAAGINDPETASTADVARTLETLRRVLLEDRIEREVVAEAGLPVSRSPAPSLAAPARATPETMEWAELPKPQALDFSVLESEETPESFELTELRGAMSALEDDGEELAARLSRADSLGRREDEDLTWRELGGGSEEVFYVRASEDWTNTGDAFPFVQGYRFNTDDSTVNDNLKLLVYLPSHDPNAFNVLGNQPMGDPNVREGAVIAVQRDCDGDLVCVSSYMDDPIGTIKMWSFYDQASCPGGWHVCDGTAGTVDMRGRFPVGVYENVEGVQTLGNLGAVGDYAGVVGETGGFAWHGQQENNHNDHDDHKHTINAHYIYEGGLDQHSVAMSTEDNMSGDSPSRSSGALNALGTFSAMKLRHGGSYNPWQAQSPTEESPAFADTDNRPPWCGLAFIQRIN